MDRTKLHGKVAIVTGGATGIGAGIARKLAADGSAVLIVDIDEDGAAASAERIRDGGGRASSILGDVSKEEVAKEMVARAVEEYGRLDILVQNAFGVIGYSDGSALEVDVESWRKGMDLLVMAHFLGAKYGVPAMTESGPPRRVRSRAVGRAAACATARRRPWRSAASSTSPPCTGCCRRPVPWSTNPGRRRSSVSRARWRSTSGRWGSR